MSGKVDISVVIPVYNNSTTLQELTSRLTLTLGSFCNDYEIIFINDGSKDHSLAILREQAAASDAVKVINLSRNFGQHPAICAGFEHASGDIVILMDADLQNKPEDIVILVEKLRSENADVAYTIKKSSNEGRTTRLTSVFYHYIFARIVKTNIPRDIGTFRAFNQNFLNAMLQFKEAHVLYGPLMFFMGFHACFLELSYLDSPNGKSSYTFKKRLQLAINSLISYTDIPHRVSMAFGATFLFGSLFYGLIITLQYVFFGTSMPGGSTLILLVLCLAIGSIMMTLGIIGSYVFRVYLEVLNRPRYLVKEKINLFRSRD